MMVQSFLEAVGGRGMGALELVAMDMKARGMYVCRTLSFAGATPPRPAPPLPSPGAFFPAPLCLVVIQMQLHHEQRHHCDIAG